MHHEYPEKQKYWCTSPTRDVNIDLGYLKISSLFKKKYHLNKVISNIILRT